MKKYVIALDQGTTSSRAIIFDKDQNILDISQKEFTQIYPHEGWVEHNPMEIWSSQYGVLQEVLAKSNITKEEIAALLAIPRPSLSRELINLRNLGYIKFDRKKITVLDIESLEEELFN